MSRQTFVKLEIAFLLTTLVLAVLGPPTSFLVVYILAYIYLLIGWLVFSIRVFPNIEIDFPSVGLAVVCIVLLAVGLHYFCSWLYREIAKKRELQRLGPDDAMAALPTWKIRTTLSILGIIMLMFVAGISAVGVIHQFVWLRTRQ